MVLSSQVHNGSWGLGCWRSTIKKGFNLLVSIALASLILVSSFCCLTSAFGFLSSNLILVSLFAFGSFSPLNAFLSLSSLRFAAVSFADFIFPFFASLSLRGCHEADEEDDGQQDPDFGHSSTSACGLELPLSWIYHEISLQLIAIFFHDPGKIVFENVLSVLSNKSGSTLIRCKLTLPRFPSLPSIVFNTVFEWWHYIPSQFNNEKSLSR